MRSLVVLSVLLALLLEFLLPSWLLAPRRVDRASAWYMARTSRAVNRPSTRQGISFMTALYSHRLMVSITSGVSQEVWGVGAGGRRQEAGKVEVEQEQKQRQQQEEEEKQQKQLQQGSWKQTYKMSPSTPSGMV